MPIPSHADFEKFSQAQLARFQRLTERFAAGKVRRSEWEDAFHAILFDGHSEAWALGRQRAGVAGSRTEDDERIGLGRADEQNQYLRGFADALEKKDPRYFDENGDLRHDPVNDRCAMYVARMRGTANEAFVSASEDEDLFDWIYGPTEHCADCVELHSLSPFTKDTIISHPGDGQTECMTACACRLIRRRDGLSGFDRPDIYRGDSENTDMVTRDLLDDPAEVTVETDDATLAKATKHVFGKELTPDEIRNVVAAPSGSVVKIDADAETIRVRVAHEAKKIELDRTYSLDSDGKPFAFHGLTTIENAPPYTGLRILAREVQEYVKLGLDRIENLAAGSPGDKLYNGYYTWARYGFNMELDARGQRAAAAAGYPGVKDLNELFVRGGADWWRKHGYEGPMVFDLSDGSASRDLLQLYLEYKKIRP